ncbi:PREDICTED: beta-glucosidase 10-like [Ipomoea nil]|uniref:beta-glucosidase 10-like n=1 Tax=Ipomoea nil TaxID=35883 RepID=UPI000901BF79|nr:PREDICTED: beta-glucosidase 10-like [Ipomoea nil]
MKMKITLHLLLLSCLFSSSPLVSGVGNFTRDDFPAGFIFGAGTSAYQVEGAAFEDGRTPSIWDTYAYIGMYGGANGDVACDQYHKYKEDVRLMSETNLEAYRFSISWSRLIPNGRGPVNEKGLQYYNNLIDELISHGIEPHVTLSHSDLPQALEDEYQGWVNRKIVEDFTAYADECFKAFGDRVVHWTTLNEPNVFIMGGYDEGFLPPMHCSYIYCPSGNSSTEPYIAGHYMLLAHASAVNLYRTKYQPTQHGTIGFNMYTYGLAPYSNSTEDLAAVERLRAFYIGWLINPLIFGDYPDIMKNIVGTRLPVFTEDEANQVKGSADFIGLNHYTTITIKDRDNSSKNAIMSFSNDIGVSVIFPDNAPPGQFPVLPEGLYNVLEHFKQFYGNPPIYIHENGQQMIRNGTLNDTPRVEYFQAFIGTVLDAIRNGSNTIGYFAWTLLDGLELLSGYKSGFGLYYVDLDDKERSRYPKYSQHWYAKFLQKNRAVI